MHYATGETSCRRPARDRGNEAIQGFVPASVLIRLMAMTPCRFAFRRPSAVAKSPTVYCPAFPGNCSSLRPAATRFSGNTGRAYGFTLRVAFTQRRTHRRRTVVVVEHLGNHRGRSRCRCNGHCHPCGDSFRKATAPLITILTQPIWGSIRNQRASPAECTPRNSAER